MKRPLFELVFPDTVETTSLELADLMPRVLERLRQVPEVHRRQIEVLTAPHDRQLTQFAWLYFLSDGRPTGNGEVSYEHTRRWPFRRKLFRNVEETAVISELGDDKISRLRKWLYHRAIPFDRQVYVCVGQTTALKTTWKVFNKFWNTFHLPVDDVVVFDQSLRWCLFIWHESTAYFGTNEPRSPDPLTWDGNIWLFGPDWISAQDFDSENE